MTAIAREFSPRNVRRATARIDADKKENLNDAVIDGGENSKGEIVAADDELRPAHKPKSLKSPTSDVNGATTATYKFKHKSTPTATAIACDGKHVIVGDGNGGVYFYG